MSAQVYKEKNCLMNVIKWDGREEPVSFDKILRRIDTLCKRLQLTRINTAEVARDTINGLFDGITTEEIDHFASVNCAEKISDDPQYDKLAAALCVSRLHKMTNDSFMNTTDKLRGNTDKFGAENPLITNEYYDFVKNNIDVLQGTINYLKDYDFDYFGFKSLERAYLHKESNANTKTTKNSKRKGKKQGSDVKNIIERPQHLLMRVAAGLNMDSIDDAIETYQGLSDRYFVFGSPTLYNTGSRWNQLSSCFLLKMADNIEHIYDTIKDIALISKRAGGIGVSVSDLRASGSIIRGTNGTSSGPIPFIQELNWTGRAVNQGGRRNGAIATYTEPWHADIFHFCELRSNKGNDEERARDIFLALWIPDLFMKRVRDDGVWSLMCPDECQGLTQTYGDEFEALYTKYEKEKRYKRQIKAKELWFHILTQQIETGMPYMLYKDHVNRQSNHKNLGVIQSSNLCVSGDTYVLTDKGQFPIKDIVNQQVNVWNGKEWSDVTIKQTGTDKKLVKITLSNGVSIKCTPEHKFYLMGGSRHQKQIMVQANQLKLSDPLIKYDLPTIKLETTNDMKYAYTHGFFCGDGTTYDNYSGTLKYPKAYLYGDKKKLLEHLIYESYSENTANDRYDLVLPKDLATKFFVPINQSTDTVLKWLEGLCDADGTIVRNGTNEGIQIGNIEKEFLLKIKLMLQVIGIDSKVTKSRDAMKKMMPDHKGGEKEYDCKKLYRLLINSNGLYKLSQLGFKPHRLIFEERLPQREASQFIKVKSIKTLDEKENTYCFTEEKRHMGMFNGILTGQCSEIVQYTSPDEIAVCNLSSICLPRFIEKNGDKLEFNFKKLQHIAGVVTKNLNKVIDINFYPVEKAKRSNMKHRPIGIGVQGLADVYCILDLPFDSDEARILNRKIFETIYFGALKMSMELAKKYGKYETFDYNGGCPFSKGQLQFHLWGLTEDDLLMGFDWKGLIEDIIKYGVRNSLLTTVMPTATTSQIMGNIESIEPLTQNIYTRSTLAGEFIVINKYLMEKLIALKIWNKDIMDELIYDKGSIQAIQEIPDSIKAVFKTAYEIKNKPIVQQAIERGPFIDQSQSLNLFCAVPDFEMLTSSHFYTWNNKLKTGLYYLRSLPAVDPISFGLDMDTIHAIKKKRAKVNNKSDESSSESSSDDESSEEEVQVHKTTGLLTKPPCGDACAS